MRMRNTQIHYQEGTINTKSDEYKLFFLNNFVTTCSKVRERNKDLFQKIEVFQEKSVKIGERKRNDIETWFPLQYFLERTKIEKKSM